MSFQANRKVFIIEAFIMMIVHIILNAKFPHTEEGRIFAFLLKLLGHEKVDQVDNDKDPEEAVKNNT
jgi:hypothetical protein